MKLTLKDKLILIVLSALILFSLKAFFIPGFYTSHDGETHTARLANYFMALEQGQFPPQLAPTLYGGFGFPIFIFIYPLPYFLGSLFHLANFSYTASAEAVMFVGHFLSGIFMYFFLRLESKKAFPSFLGALFFAWAPYRFLMLFVRGAFAESFAYVFVPLVLIGVHQLIVKPKPRWIGFTALTVAGLLLSHQLTSIMFLPVIVWYTLYKLTFVKNKKPIIIALIISLILGFITASFIYLPAFYERKYLRFDNLISYTNDHFVTLKQLIRSPWSYGFSKPGHHNDDMSFQVGLTHWSAIGLASFMLLLAAFRSPKAIWKNPNRRALLFWLFAFFLSILLMLDYQPIHQLWQNLPGLNYLDFPWRFIGVSATAASFVVFYLLLLKPRTIFYLFFLFFVVYANRNHLRINQTVNFSDAYFESYANTATWQNEFLTQHRTTNTYEHIEGDYQLIRGLGEIHQNELKTHLIDLDINSSGPSELMLHRLYFPGWQVKLDGQTLRLEDEALDITGSEVDIQTGADTSGFIKINLPSGQHHILAQFKPTPIRQLGQILSIIGLIISLVFIIFNQKLDQILIAHLSD